MAALMDAYEKAQSGSGQVVGVVGDAGVGKSRLLLEFRKRLPEGEISYHEGRCLHFGSAMSFLPLLDVLRSYFEIKEGDQELDIKKNMEDKILQLDENLRDVLPPFHELLSLDIEDEAYQKLEPTQKREKAFEAIRDLLVRESQGKPVILVVEDLHWIDKTSEAFLDYLIGWLAGTSILLLLLYRPEYTHPWGSKSYYNRIGLDQLTTKSSAELIRAILQDGEPVPELKELILNRAAGNPLFMEEFTHTLLENGAIQFKDQKCALIQKASDIQVPDTIQGIIAARMDRLEDDLKKTMQVASVIGRDFAFRILDAITGMKEELKPYLLNLQRLEFIYEKQLFPELQYIFKHALIQEVAYQSLLIKRRKALHERIGQAIEQLYADRLEENYEVLAHHYYLSRNIEAAFHYLKFSGQKAMRNNSTWEAFSYYKKAISVLDRLPEDTEQKSKKLELIHLAINPIIALGFPENSLSIFEQGESLAREFGDERSLIRFRSNIGYFYCSTGNYLKAVNYTEQAFLAAEKIGDIESIGQVIGDLWVVCLPTAEHARIIAVIPRVIDALEKAQKQAEFFGGLSNVYSTLFAYYGYSQALQGNFKDAINFCEMGLQASAEIDSAITLGLCESAYGIVHLFKGDLGLAKQHLIEGIEQIEEAEFLLSLGQSLSWLGLAYTLAGEPDAGRKYADRGLKIHEDAAMDYMRTIHHYVLGICHSYTGDDTRAEEFFKTGIEISRQKNERCFEGALWIWLGRVLAKKHPPKDPEAMNHILKGIEISKALSQRPDLAVGNLFLGELYAEQGQKETARTYLTKSMNMFADMEMNYWLPEAQKILANIQN